MESNSYIKCRFDEIKVVYKQILRVNKFWASAEIWTKIRTPHGLKHCTFRFPQRM